MKNPAAFFAGIKPSLFSKGFTQHQVDGINSILAALDTSSINDLRYRAYIFGTIYHECAGTMQPIAEYGKGANHDYGKKLDMGSGPGHRIPYTTPDQLYYGRGYVQLTWKCNYASQAKLLGVDLLNNPDLALQPEIAAKICIHGMVHGDFTGKYLAEYFNPEITDWTNARKIINGLDCADLIAGHAKTFYQALENAA
jgi:putative chitinase